MNGKARHCKPNGDVYDEGSDKTTELSTRLRASPGPFAYKRGSFPDNCDPFFFWSLHSGGANFAFGDGSVGFLPYSADAILATRAGGETVEVP